MQNERYRRQQHFVLAMRLALMQNALATWPRRAAPLLEINCGSGVFLPFLWQCGFDVEATEKSMELRAQAYDKNIPGLKITAADEDMLPFDNDEFDWAILHLKASSEPDIDKALAELVRVARRGVMLTFWNSCSLAGVKGKKNEPEPGFAFLPWWRLWRKLKGLQAGRTRSMTGLWGPPSTWNRYSRWSFVNDWISHLPFGAWCILRLEMAPPHLVTPLAAGLRGAGSRTEPAPDARLAHRNK